MQSSQAHKVSQHSIVQLLHRAQTNYNQTSSPYMPQIIFILKTSQSMSLMKKAKDRIQWYHISYCHSMISFPSLLVFWKPEYKISVNIDFKPEYKVKYWFQTYHFFYCLLGALRIWFISCLLLISHSFPCSCTWECNCTLFENRANLTFLVLLAKMFIMFILKMFI